MSRLTDRLERDLREIAAGAEPSPSAWESIAARLGDDAASELAFVRAPSPERSKRGAWIAAVAAAFVVIAGAIAVLTSAGDDPSTSPADESPTTTFVSPRNGFSVEHAEGATVTPATNLFDPGGGDGVDVVETASGAVFEGASLPAPGGPLSVDDYVDDYVLDDGCGAPRLQQAEITIDGHPGRLSACPEEIVATVVTSGRIYQFTLRHGGSDARAVFDAFAATIRLTPETAVDLPDMTAGSTFVSRTNGFSVRYPRGSITRAAGPWRPDIEQWPDERRSQGELHPAFDYIETGFGAVFLGASTAIPNGVPLDEWIDATVVKHDAVDCRVPRDHQAEVAIDGRSARILECPEEITATVVADGRLYQFGLWHSQGDEGRAFFDGFLAAIDLRPEDAATR